MQQSSESGSPGVEAAGAVSKREGVARLQRNAAILLGAGGGTVLLLMWIVVAILGGNSGALVVATVVVVALVVALESLSRRNRARVADAAPGGEQTGQAD